MNNEFQPVSKNAQAQISSATVIRFLRLRGRLMLAVVASITLLTAAFAYLIPGSYSSTGLVLIERGKSPTFRSDPVRYELESAEVLNSEIGILTSRTVTEKVIDQLVLDQIPMKDSAMRRLKARLGDILDRLGLSEKQSQRARLIKRMTKSLKVEQVPSSSLLRISFRAEDAAFAAVVARTYMDTYIERHREIYSDTSATFFETRFKDSEQTLAQLREAISRETEPARIQGMALQREALETTYRFYRERWDRAKADAAGELSLVNVRAVDYPAVPLRRVHSRLFLILVALLGSCVFAVAIGLIWDFFDHTVHDESDIVCNVDVPMLGTVRRARNAGRFRR